MFGFVTRRHLDDVVREKDRQIEILADQIDWLRAYVGKPSIGPTLNPSGQPPAMAQESPWLSEEEEDLLHLHKSGQMNDTELERALAEIGFQSTEIESLLPT